MFGASFWDEEFLVISSDFHGMVLRGEHFREEGNLHASNKKLVLVPGAGEALDIAESVSVRVVAVEHADVD